jgi:hypothetical protein
LIVDAGRPTLLSKLRSNLNYANVMATIAVFMALGGGAYAAIKLPANSVGSKQLKKKAVTPAKVAPGTVKLFKGQKGNDGTNGANGANGRNGTDGTNGQPALSAFVGRISNLHGDSGLDWGAPSGDSASVAPNDNAVYAVAPNATSTARDLFVELTSSETQPRLVQLDVNGSAAIACTVPAAGTMCNSGGQTATIPPGAHLSIQTHLVCGGSCGPPGTPPQARFAWRATTP